MKNQFRIISHRLRGFGLNDASPNALRNAISAGVKLLEVDIRFTQDGIPVINHDPHLKASFNKDILIRNLTFKEIKLFNYSKDSDSIHTLEELLLETKDKSIILFLDIKEAGFEEYVYNMLYTQYSLENIVIISWLPEVLKKFYLLDPDLKLCFSHVPFQNPFIYSLTKMAFTIFRVNTLLSLLSNFRIFGKFEYMKYCKFIFNKYNENIKNEVLKNTPDFEHFVNGNLTGELLNILQNSNGYVCVPKNFINLSLVEYYKRSGVGVVVYTINEEWEKILTLQILEVDLILTDNKYILLEEIESFHGT